MKIGILALQGAFIEHKKLLEASGVECVEIRQRKDLSGLDGLILPGGESTVQGNLLHRLKLFAPLQEMIQKGLPVLATCAGLILLAKEIEQDRICHLQTLPITVKRNAYGRQTGSFVTRGDVLDITDFPLVFIRAPYITKATEDVTILARHDGHIVGVEYQNQMGLAFHPEMTGDLRIHQRFLRKVQQYKETVGDSD